MRASSRWRSSEPGRSRRTWAGLMRSSTAPRDDHRAAVRFIVCFGLVSLFADMTYEGAHSIVGPLLKGLGASAAAVAIIAGLGEMIAASLRFFSGRFADRTGGYWKIAIAGYAINLVAVPALAFVGTWQAAAALIIVERAGKAMRGPSRDVLISEANDVVGHGFGWGVHAAMDQVGAIAGPLIVAAIVAGIALSLGALPLAFLGGPTGAVASVVCWGIGMGAQDATLRSGIAGVVSMNKRGTAFGTFNAVFGVMWFFGSAAMGLLYDHSLVLLVAFGVAAQLIAAVVFLGLRTRLAAHS